MSHTRLGTDAAERREVSLPSLGGFFDEMIRGGGMSIDGYRVTDGDGNVLVDFEEECREKIQEIADIVNTIRKKIASF